MDRPLSRLLRTGVAAVAAVALVSCSSPTRCEAPSAATSAAATTSTASEAPNPITVTAGHGTELAWAPYDVEDKPEQAMAALADEHNLKEAPIVPIGSLVSVTFSGAQPDKVVVSDDIAIQRGTPRPSLDADAIALSEQDGAFTFSLPINYAVFTSSNSDDYLPGAVIRGFTLTAMRGGTAKMYTLVLRTNADMG